jgi:hypothetical protein
MDVNDRDSELHSLFSTLLNQHPAWNNMPTANVGALQQCFEWFNEMGKRIDAGLKAQEEREAAAEAEAKEPTKPQSKKQKVS